MFLLILLSSLILTACQPQGKDQYSVKVNTPVTEVSVISITPRNLPIYFEHVGQVTGSREIEIRARVAGFIERRLFVEGAQVNAGTVLYELDDAPFRAQLAIAEAKLQETQTRVSRAEREYKRLQPLAGKKLISQKIVDDTASELDMAKAERRSAEARLLNAQINLKYTTVKAPISGIIGRALKVEGALVQPEGDSLLTTLAQTDPAYVNFSVSETDHINLRREVTQNKIILPENGFSVELLSSSGEPLNYSGKLNFSDYKADPNTGSFAARATFPNSTGELLPGQFVRVMLNGAQRANAIAVPQKAVLDGPNGKYVYILTIDNQGNFLAKQRPVQVGEWVKISKAMQNGWIIRKGLKPGDQLIVEGIARIFAPNTVVKPVPFKEVPIGFLPE